MKQITACTYDCPDACSLILEQTPEGGISTARKPGQPLHPRGHVRKTRRHIRRLRSPSRIFKTPDQNSKRLGGDRLDAALDLCAEKIQRLRSERPPSCTSTATGPRESSRRPSTCFFPKWGRAGSWARCATPPVISRASRISASRDNNDIEDLENAAAHRELGQGFFAQLDPHGGRRPQSRSRGARVLTISPGGDGNGPFCDVRIRIRPGTEPLSGKPP